MLLEIGKAVSFLFSMLALTQVAGTELSLPSLPLHQGLTLLLARIAVAVCFCVGSGMLFLSGPHPSGEPRLTATLPVRLLLWSMLAFAALLVLSWLMFDLVRDAGPFVSNRTLQRF